MIPKGFTEISVHWGARLVGIMIISGNEIYQFGKNSPYFESYDKFTKSIISLAFVGNSST